MLHPPIMLSAVRNTSSGEFAVFFVLSPQSLCVQSMDWTPAGFTKTIRVHLRLEVGNIALPPKRLHIQTAESCPPWCFMKLHDTEASSFPNTAKINVFLDFNTITVVIKFQQHVKALLQPSILNLLSSNLQQTAFTWIKSEGTP